MTTHNVAINSSAAWTGDDFSNSNEFRLVGKNTTWITDNTKHYSWPKQQPYDYYPPQPQVGIDEELFKKAFGQPVMMSQYWRESDDEKSDQKILSTDVPGVHENSLKVQIIDGVLTAIGLRFDTNETVERKFDLGHKYDPSTAKADLSHGVLMIKIKKHEKFADRSIEINASGD